MSDLFKRIVCTLLLVLVSFGFSLNASATNRFQWIMSTDYVTISYDTRSVKYYSAHGKVVDVWTSWNYTEDGASKYVEGGRTTGLFQEAKWDNFSYSLNHMLISKNSYLLLDVIFYDVNSNVIFSLPFNKDTKWTGFVPCSLNEKIRDKFKGFLDS